MSDIGKAKLYKEFMDAIRCLNLPRLRHKKKTEESSLAANAGATEECKSADATKRGEEFVFAEIACDDYETNEYSYRILNAEEAAAWQRIDIPWTAVFRDEAILMATKPLKALTFEMCDDAELIMEMEKVFTCEHFNCTPAQFKAFLAACRAIEKHIEKWVNVHHFAAAEAHFTAEQQKEAAQKKRRRVAEPKAKTDSCV